ncbi:MAG: vWA domain-containing protein, partial [Planctomycetota bacterium]
MRQILSTVAMLAITASLAVASTESARLYVVDVSGSMAGRTMKSVRDELNASLTIQPPTEKHPIAIITFDSKASKPKIFRDAGKALKFVKTLASSGGGTDIAAGLNEAIRRLKQLNKVSRTAVLLYTDDRSGNRKAIEKAERELDKIFKQRNDKGLQQSLILRNWSNPGLTSVVTEVLGDNPWVDVVQGKNPLVLTPTTINPSATL